MVVRLAPDGQGDGQVLALAIGQRNDAQRPHPDVGRLIVGEVVLLPGDPERDGQHGDDPGRPQVKGRPDRHVLQHPTIDIVVVGQGPGREDHGNAGRGERPFDHVDRSGGDARGTVSWRRLRRWCPLSVT